MGVHGGDGVCGGHDNLRLPRVREAGLTLWRRSRRHLGGRPQSSHFIATYNPELDRDDSTLRVALRLLQLLGDYASHPTREEDL